MKYIIRKICVFIITLTSVSMLAFIAFQLVPGDPVTKMLGTEATPERAEALREELGFNRPVYLRYAEWLTGFATGKLGLSYSFNMPVSELLGSKVPITAALSAMSFILVIIISLPVSLLLARYGGGVFDKIMLVLNQIVMSIPPFFTGIILTLLFGVVFKLFEPGAYIPFNSDPSGFFAYLFFPALAIALPRSAMTIKLLRGSILGEMSKDYVRTAYSRGNSRWDVLRNHVIRNAVIPVVTFLALTLADIVAGSIIIEQVFAIPGIGRLLLLSISNRDFPVVQSIVVMIAFIVLFVNLIADIAYQYIDPRIRLST